MRTLCEESHASLDDWMGNIQAIMLTMVTMFILVKCQKSSSGEHARILTLCYISCVVFLELFNLVVRILM
jgi:hypothetical protein